MKFTNSYNSKLRYKRFFSILLFVLLALNHASIAFGQNAQKQKVMKTSMTQGPYCGIYCLHAAIKLAGKESNIADLIKPEYIGSRKGSSLAELKKAAQDHGMYALPVGNLTRTELLACPYPMILHVKSSELSKEYDHFELFLGIKNEKVRIFDPPNPVAEIPFNELARRWDGTGLIVSSTPIQTAAMFALARWRALLYAFSALIIIMLVHWLRRYGFPSWQTFSRLKRLSLSLGQCGLLFLCALSAGLLYHFASDIGFLAHANATETLVQAHRDNFIPKVKKADLQKLIHKDTIIIDARFESDYQAGHIEGAVNIPVNSTDEEFNRITTELDKHKSIVVYCQSRGCEFDQTIALKLIAADFTNVAVYQGGWLAWTGND